MSQNYLNIYLFSIFGCVVATIGGILICYSGMSESSYLAYQGSEIMTFYLDKNRYELYANGLIYSLTFGIAFLLCLAVILIPSPEQIKKRQSSSQLSSTPNAEKIEPMETSIQVDESFPEQESPNQEVKEIELEPDLENFDVEEKVKDSEILDESHDESDVVYGTGRITDLSHKSFILSNPDSAVKFLLRKELDGRPLKSSQEAIYEEWQKRGLSRGKLRKHVLKIMGWDNVPELEVLEIYNKLKEKAYEIKHSENI